MSLWVHGSEPVRFRRHAWPALALALLELVERDPLGAWDFLTRTPGYNSRDPAVQVFEQLVAQAIRRLP